MSGMLDGHDHTMMGTQSACTFQGAGKSRGPRQEKATHKYFHTIIFFLNVRENTRFP